MNRTGTPLARSVPRRPRFAAGNQRAYRITVHALDTVRRDGQLQIVTRGPHPVILFAADEADPDASREVHWLDFAIELIAGLVALMTGIRIGRRGYMLLRPVIIELWRDEGFRRRVEVVGEFARAADVLATGMAVIEMWRYLWAEHRSTLFRGILRAVGSTISPRSLFVMLVRWLARLISAGAVLAVEIGLLVIPLARKLVSV